MVLFLEDRLQRNFIADLIQSKSSSIHKSVNLCCELLSGGLKGKRVRVVKPWNNLVSNTDFSSLS